MSDHGFFIFISFYFFISFLNYVLKTKFLSNGIGNTFLIKWIWISINKSTEPNKTILDEYHKVTRTIIEFKHQNEQIQMRTDIYYIKIYYWFLINIWNDQQLWIQILFLKIVILNWINNVLNTFIGQNKIIFVWPKLINGMDESNRKYDFMICISIGIGFIVIYSIDLSISKVLYIQIQIKWLVNPSICFMQIEGQSILQLTHNKVFYILSNRTLHYTHFCSIQILDN